MAQEQAKSPAEKEAPEAQDEARDEGNGPLSAMMRGNAEAKSSDRLAPERSSDLPRRSTLAERLKAEQRKREEPKREESRREELRREEPKREEPKTEEAKPLQFSEAQTGTSTPRQFTRTRRPAGPPPQRRLAPPANDDVPSIGGLIFALQQRPAKTPFLVALIASAVWFVVGGFFAFGLISSEGGALLTSAQGLTAAVAILVPIAIFWFLALLVWRAQELRLMASAMTEVAVRLAEPDRLAEQSVASVGQTIRRQVAAMNDAISRAIGRASELEAMVHSEVAALERSYGENELRVRNLISELATEREALANNSARVSEALKGVGAQVARDISAASGAIDKKLAERGTQLTELLVARSSEAADQVHKAQNKIAEAVPGLLERLSKEQGRLTHVIDGATKNLASLETVVAQRTTALDKTMKERTEALQSSLADRIKGLETSVAQGAIFLDKTLKERTDGLAATIAENAGALDKMLTDRTEAFTNLVSQGTVILDNTLKERTEAFTNLVSQGAVVLDKTLQQRTEALSVSIGEGAATIDKTLKERTDAFTNLVSQGAVVLEKTLQERTNALATSIGDGAAALDETLAQRTNAFAATADQKAAAIDKSLHDRTAQFISAVNQGAIALDRTLAERADTFTNTLIQRVKTLETAISQQTGALDKTMTERAQAVIIALAERLQAIDSTFAQRNAETNKMLTEHTRATEATFGKQAAAFNQVLANNSTMMKQTADQLGAQSKEAIGALTSQTQNLRDVSRGLLEQIHALTQRFESQGQAILTAAKALDSSNTKIDSILESRHQAIIGLLHTVNTKAQDLDGTMHSYAGMVENALTQAEKRAKQVTTALARDTAGGAQQALAQIERLREEAKAHTSRAVGDLKGSFETVITQIGRQLEQMRSQFDNTSRGMRETAQKTASDLDSIRQEMQKRMEALPEHTAQATAAIRKALSEQLREIEAITPGLTRAPQQASAPDPYRQPPPPPPPQPQQMPPPLRGQGFQPRPEEARPPGNFGLPPMPKFDARGRQMAEGSQPEGGGELDQITGSLAQQLAGAAPPRGPSPADHGGQQGNWSVGDLLARASGPAPGQAQGAPQGYQQGGPPQGYPQQGAPQGYPQGGQGYPQGGQGYGQPAQAPQAAGGQMRLDEAARAIDQRTAAEVWQRLRAGERGVLSRHIYTPEGQAMFDEIVQRYDHDGGLRAAADHYMGDFERLLGEAEQSDPEGRMLNNYLSSESGRTYLLLAHASGRLR